MQSLKSDALEPSPDDLKGKNFFQVLVALLPVYGLVVISLLLIALFSFLLPRTFPTPLNFKLTLSSQAVTAMLALAAMIPMVAGKIDLSIGYGVVLWMVLAIGLQTYAGLPWLVALVIVLALSALVGVFNALLVELAKIDAFIATLGTGTVIYAIALAYTKGQQVIGELPKSFLAIGNGNFLGLPIVGYYVLIISVVMWLVLEFTPIGRFLYAIGANPAAARLNGIPVRRYIIGAFVASGMLAALAGVVLASKLRIGQIGVGLDYLLPALVAAFLGSTTIRPGRVNVWGTVVGIITLSVGISGLQQLQSGEASWVTPLFNGLTLLLAIGMASLAGRRRVRLQKNQENQDQKSHHKDAKAQR
jgi:ribose transport system permease protein